MMVFALLASVVHCVVGSGSGSPDQQALHVLECDTETGAAKIVQSVKGIQGTTYFQFDGGGRWLYSAIGEKKDGKTVGSVVRFLFEDGRIGAMERLFELPFETPCHVSLTPDGRRVAFATYGSAHYGSVGIARGERDLAACFLPDDAKGPDRKRQEKAHAHFTFFTPDGKAMGVIDLGCDRIRFCDPATTARVGLLDVKADPGDGPRHAVWSKDGRFLFVINELGNSVTSFSFDGKAFAKVGKWSTLSVLKSGEAESFPLLKGESSFSKAAAIKLTADGRILMASNRGYDSIAFYNVRDDGTLALRNVSKLVGRFPRDFELMPGERFMVVGHKMSDEIQVYRFDRTAFRLTPVGDPIPVWRPLCFKFAH